MTSTLSTMALSGEFLWSPPMSRTFGDGRFLDTRTAPGRGAAHQRQETNRRSSGPLMAPLVQGNQQWGETDAALYKPLLDYIFDTFGEDKLIFGSDWPNGPAVDNLPVIVQIVKDYFYAKGPTVAERYFWKNS